MIRAVIYCRCSTEEACQRDALVRQAAEARECVRRLNWFLADEYIESRSGTSIKGRTEYQRLFADLESDQFDVVVIKSQDRLMRNTREWYIFIDRLVICKKRLYLYLENRFYSTDDALLTGIKAILAEEYSRELSRKINNAHRNRQKTGSALMLTSNTYGYRKLPDKSFAIIENEAKIKRQMYELCAAGYGSRTIARILRESGLCKRNGKFFSDSDIRRMIRNPINKGTVVMNRKHYDFDTKMTVKNEKNQLYIYENRIPAIVSENLWEKANREIDNRKIKKERADNRKNVEWKAQANQNVPEITIKYLAGMGKNKGKHVLSNHLVCGLCGAPFYRTTRKRKCDRVYEWKCRTYLEQGRKKSGKTGGCENIHLEEKLLFFILYKIFFPDSLSAWENSLKTAMQKLVHECFAEEEKKDRETSSILLKKIESQQKLLLDKYLEGIVEEQQFREKQKLLQKKYNEEISRMAAGKNSSHLKPDGRLVEERLLEMEEFLGKRDIVSRAMVLCMLKDEDKIMVFPEYLEIWGKCYELNVTVR